MRIHFPDYRWVGRAAEIMLECYKSDEPIEIDYCYMAHELRVWLEIFDEIDAAGYHPKYVLSKMVWQTWWAAFWRDFAVAKATYHMAMDIWTRGYLAEKAGVA